MSALVNVAYTVSGNIRVSGSLWDVLPDQLTDPAEASASCARQSLHLPPLILTTPPPLLTPKHYLKTPH